MIETLISSKTRIKLLLKFFLNSSSVGYLRGLENEFGESSNAIRLELNRFEKANMLISYSKGNKKFFQANNKHPLFKEVHNIVLKYIGFDKIIINVVERLGDVKKVYVTGDFAKGKNSKIIDLLFVGDINQNYLIDLTAKAEKLVGRKIRYIIYKDEVEIDWSSSNEINPILLWEAE